MDFYRVIFLLMLVTSGVFGNPQWQNRQSSLSSPLSMGMRFLDNIRSGMTRTIGRIFGNGGAQQGKEVPQARPVRQHLTPPPAAPPAHVHNIGSVQHNPGTEAPSSFFTVLHDNSEPATPFPDTHGFTDESFRPSEFFTGNSPFQGNVEEETLPFQTNEIHSPQVSSAIGHQISPESSPQGPSFAVFDDGQSQPAHGEVFHSDFNEGQSFDSPGVSIPFGNTNHFSLGHTFRQGPSGPSQLPLAPRPTFTHEDFLPREDQKISHPGPQQQHQSAFLTSRADGQKQKTKPLTSSKTKNPTPLPSLVKPAAQNFNTEPPSQSTTFKVTHSKPTVTFSHKPTVTFSHKPTVTFSHKPTVTFSDKPTVTHTDNPTVTFRSSSTVSDFTKNPTKPRATIIDAGTKRQVTPKLNGDGEETEVSSYEFGYGVLDNDTGNQFFHAEKREEGLTKGSYKIQLPDGRIQTVTYRADNQGFHPQITYEGQARYPENVHKKHS